MDYYTEAFYHLTWNENKEGDQEFVIDELEQIMEQYDKENDNLEEEKSAKYE